MKINALPKNISAVSGIEPQLLNFKSSAYTTRLRHFYVSLKKESLLKPSTYRTTMCSCNQSLQWYYVCSCFLSVQALRLAKNLIRETEKERLYKVNRAECDLLVDRWTSDECAQALMNYFSNQSFKDNANIPIISIFIAGINSF